MGWVEAGTGYDCGSGHRLRYPEGGVSPALSLGSRLAKRGRRGGGFELHGVAHALSSEPFSLVRGATAIISPLGLTSTSVAAMLALLVGAIGTESCLRSA